MAPILEQGGTTTPHVFLAICHLRLPLVRGDRQIGAQTLELSIDTNRHANCHTDPNNILFIGGPGELPDVIFDHGFE